MSSTFTVQQFSPSKLHKTRSPELWSSRCIQPTPEKLCPTSTLLISPSKTPAKAAAQHISTGSLKSKHQRVQEDLTLSKWQELFLVIICTKCHAAKEFAFQSVGESLDLQTALQQTNNVELSFSLVSNGRAIFPPPDGEHELLNLFPSTIGFYICPPFLTFHVGEKPMKPWPFTVGGLILQFITDERELQLEMGDIGHGTPLLSHLNLLDQTDEFSYELCDEVLQGYCEQGIYVHTLIWCGDYWRVTVADGTVLQNAPALIAQQLVWYQFHLASSTPSPSSAMRSIEPTDLVLDNTDYIQQSDGLLRPGDMFSSSNDANGKYKCSTSGVLVRDPNGQVLITAAAHTFNPDGLVYHPTPSNGPPIGRVIHQCPLLDLALVKLNRGTCYINECFHTESGSTGPVITGLLHSANAPPLNVYASVYMDNPFSGRCQGMITGLGVTVEGCPGISYIPITFLMFNGAQEGR